jgi:large subunit ribosomal protein L45
MSSPFEEQRAKAKKDGIDPSISFEYKPINMAASGEIFNPFVPPEGDGKRTILSKEVNFVLKSTL